VLEELKTDQDDNEKESRQGLRSKIQRLGDLRESADQLAQQHQEKTLKLEYKSRPARRHLVHGAYLHNGSVPKPGRAAQAREPAAVEVLRRHALLRSQETSALPRFRRRAPSSSTRRKPGNRNTGHGPYRPRGGGEPHVFTDAERWAIVEYLKTL
jgi:hypothetical protein